MLYTVYCREHDEEEALEQARHVQAQQQEIARQQELEQINATKERERLKAQERRRREAVCVSLIRSPD